VEGFRLRFGETRLGFSSEGIGRHRGFVLFVRRFAPDWLSFSHFSYPFEKLINNNMRESTKWKESTPFMAGKKGGKPKEKDQTQEEDCSSYYRRIF